MNRVEWIALTIGLEVRRAAEHTEQLDVATLFDEHDHSDTRTVDIRWWYDGKLKSFQRCRVLTPDDTDNTSSLIRPGPYVPDGYLPEGPWWQVQIVVYSDDVDINALDETIVSGSSLTTLEVQRSIDASIGACTYGTIAPAMNRGNTDVR